MESEENLVAMINGAGAGWVHETGLRMIEATAERVVATLTVGPRHHQGYGIVHGGVYCSVIETLASVGAHVHAARSGRAVAGLENHTSFIRSIRAGDLTATATPITRGRRSQVWNCDIVDADGRMIATGRVRLHVFDPGDEIAGAPPRLDRG